MEQKSIRKARNQKLPALLLYLISRAFSSAIAIHNLSYPASSNGSPPFSISHHNSPRSPGSHNNSPLFVMSNSNSPCAVPEISVKPTTSQTNASPLPFQHNSPPFPVSQYNSSHSYSNSLGANHGSNVKLTTAPANASPLSFERHQRRVHGSNSLSIGSPPTHDGRWECPHPTCWRKGPRGFNQLDFLISHCRYVHNQNMLK